MPFVHFHSANNGIVKACCVANIPYGNINESDLNSIWNGKEINDLRDKFISNEMDNRCAVCHKVEASGGDSIRLETFEKFNFKEIERIPKLPIYFDIRFSNVCNFRCRTCWHGASSKWFQDAKKLKTNLGEKAIIQNIEDLDDFLSKMRDALMGAEEFYFAGGEPLVTEEHYLLLEWLIENKATKARLRYNTNFSILNYKDYDLIELWSYFDEVELLASIDANHELGEYIRKDMDWAVILQNRKVIQAYPFIKFKIAPTVSVLNVHHLPKLYEESLASGLIDKDDLYINILERPSYYNIQILPKKIKDEIFEMYLKQMDKYSSESIKRAFQSVLDYMMADDRSELFDLFLKKNTELDHLRSEEAPIAWSTYI